MGHLFWVQIASVNRSYLAFDPAQIKKQFFLRGGGTDFHQRPASEHIFLNRGFDPPHGIGRKPEAFIRVEFFNCMHHAQIPLGNQVSHRQPIAAIPHRNFGHKPQMAGHQFMGSIHIPAFFKGFGQHKFLISFQHGKLPDLIHIS